MVRMFTVISLAAVAVLCASGQAPETKYDMVPIKYDALKAEVLKYRGKVLVVDFWAGY